MIPIEILALGPGPVDEVFTLLRRRSPGDVLALTVFVDAPEPAAYRREEGGVLSRVREVFGAVPPPVAVVAQAPSGGGAVAVEAKVLATPDAGTAVSRRSRDGVPYAVVERGGGRQLHGIAVSPSDVGGDVAAQGREAFAVMEGVLAGEGLTFGHVVRQWNYVERVLEARPGGPAARPGYQVFNDARTRAYERSEFPAGYPAATGIGQASGGVVIEFIALSAPSGVEVEPISNPHQVDAYRYSPEVLAGARSGPASSPRFERAKRVVWGDEEVVFVSGTAAIVGERSVAPGDVVAQARRTIENISLVVGGRKLSYLRAYVKRRGDIPAVRRVCEEAYGPIPSLYVTADVCRDELLVELEGALFARLEVCR